MKPTVDELNVYFAESINRSHWLQYIANKRGDFKTACSYTINSEKKFSKHWTVISCQENERYRHLETASHRQIFEEEIVLDFDESSFDNNPEQLRKIFERCLRELKHFDIEFKAFFTGSKGYHIHITVDALKINNLDLIKKNIIRKYKCDALKASNNVLIALEYAPHWKTGQQKRLLIDTTKEDVFYELSR